ncbi:hypothetical protein Tco_1557851 [Tanacetum coccineum]
MLGAAGVQIPKDNLDDLHSSREEDGTLETMDPQDLLVGLGVSLSRAIGFLRGTSVVVVMPSSQQSNVVNHSKTKITSDSSIIPYSQYVIKSQQATIQNSNSSAQQDDLILSVIEQLKTQVANCTKTNLENKSVNDTLTAELERYKE